MLERVALLSFLLNNCLVLVRSLIFFFAKALPPFYPNGTWTFLIVYQWVCGSEHKQTQTNILIVVALLRALTNFFLLLILSPFLSLGRFFLLLSSIPLRPLIPTNTDILNTCGFLFIFPLVVLNPFFFSFPPFHAFLLVFPITSNPFFLPPSQ